MQDGNEVDGRGRLSRIGSSPPATPWRGKEAREHVIAAGKRAIERWQAAQSQLGVEWPFTGDFRGSICPGFKLDRQDAEVADACHPAGLHHGQAEIPTFFLVWQRCPSTRELPNPYEPLIALWENGGGFRREGKLWELSSADGPVGGLGWPTARPVLPTIQPSSVAADKVQGSSIVLPHLAHKFTPEQWARRQVFADRLRRASTDANGRPLSAVAAQARRIIVSMVIGLGFLLAGVLALTDGTDMNEGASPGSSIQSQGLAAALGPSGTAILFVLLGLTALGISVLMLLKAARGSRSPEA